MKKYLLHTFVFVVFIAATLFLFTDCNPATGDNRESKMDSAPKPELAAITIRKDVPPVYTNTFNGNIQLIEKNLFDTITYNIYVSKNKVRIDKVQLKNNESYIFNLISNEKIILNHPNKLYSVEAFTEEKSNFDSSFKIIKTENEKNILGMKCKQWRVKNTKENTEVTYWVSSNNYGFYYYLTKIWNSNIKINKYFQIIPNSFGYMPIEMTERNLLRDLKSSLKITHISQDLPDSNLFIIPSSYAQFSN